jgi:hypothetical protein
VGIESTVLSLLHGRPILLRPGAITREQIEDVLQMNVDLPRIGEAALSPGMKYRHYAPKAEVRIVDRVPSDAEFVLSRASGRLNARNFYASLREADSKGIAIIWVLLDPISKQDDGLMNRLFRAAGGNYSLA